MMNRRKTHKTWHLRSFKFIHSTMDSINGPVMAVTLNGTNQDNMGRSCALPLSVVRSSSQYRVLLEGVWCVVLSDNGRKRKHRQTEKERKGCASFRSSDFFVPSLPSRPLRKRMNQAVCAKKKYRPSLISIIDVLTVDKSKRGIPGRTIL